MLIYSRPESLYSIVPILRCILVVYAYLLGT